MSKKAVAQSKILGERLFFDISSPSAPTFGSKKQWLLIMDDSSNFIWSFFERELVDSMYGYNLKVEHLCCDNAGENVAFKKTCKQEKQGGLLHIYIPRYATTEWLH